MKFLNPCNDVAFKKIFGSEEHQNVTISFLNSILEYTGTNQITGIQFLNTEQKGVLPDKKDNILDILCTDQKGNKYIVEVQVARMEEFDKRIVFYGAKTYSMQLGATQSYRKLDPVVAISVLDFVYFKNKPEYKSIHLLLDKKTYENDLKELSFAFIELPKFNKQAHELVTNEDKWIYFLKNIRKENDIPQSLNNAEFKEACQAVNRMTWTEEEYNSYEKAIIAADDAQGKLDFARKEGLAEGIIKGELKAKLDMAKNLLALDKFSVTDIAQATGLNINDIEQLKKK